MIDFYTLLSVEPSADRDTIRRAYRSLARRIHPDMPGGCDADMRKLNAAWSVLGDPIARRAYDVRRAARTEPADRPQAAERPPITTRPSVTMRPPVNLPADVLDFGRYAGSSLSELARRDPDYLLWLARTPVGRRYQAEIERLLTPSPQPAHSRPRSRGGLFRRMAQAAT